MRGEEYKCDIQLLLFCCVNRFFLVKTMNTHQRYMQYRKDELYHGHGGGNPYHDPKDGKFTSGPKGILSKVKSAIDNVTTFGKLDKHSRGHKYDYSLDRRYTKEQLQFGDELEKSGYEHSSFGEFTKTAKVKNSNGKDQTVTVGVPISTRQADRTEQDMVITKKAADNVHKNWSKIDKQIKAKVVNNLAQRKNTSPDVIKNILDSDAFVYVYSASSKRPPTAEVSYRGGKEVDHHFVVVEMSLDDDYKIGQYYLEG